MKSVEILNFYFAQKKALLPQYSMRALARDLELSQSYVSEILSGKKKLPLESVPQWLEILSVDELGRQELKSALFAEFLPELGDVAVPDKAADWKLSNVEEHDLLGRWYYTVLCDLVTCDDFRPDPQWMAARLGIEEVEVVRALAELVQSGFLKVEKDRYQKTKKKMKLPTTKTLSAVRNFHRQMIQLSLHELGTKTRPQDFEQRLISGATVATNPRQVAKAKQRLAAVLQEVSEILSQGPCTEVFQLNVQLFNHLNKV